MSFVEAALFLITGVLAIPSFVFFFECTAALLPERRRPEEEGEEPSTVIMVPAHDEAAGIAATLESLKHALGPKQRILVIADNCGDDTARIARACGAEAVERTDAQRRGKGYAIVFGLDHLATKEPPDVVIIVDADCRANQASMRTLARRAVETDRPVQADYVITPPEKHTPMSVVSGLAVLVKNKVRPGGLRKLGLPCHLTGSGMAFPWEVIRKAPPTGSYLVEDMLIGIELAHLGHAPISCAEAEVTSELPEKDEAARGQRRRWEHGHLATLFERGPRLVLQGILRGDFDLIAMGLDLLVPPMALQVMLLLAAVGLSWVGWAFGASELPLTTATFCLGMVGVAVFLAWFAYGKKTLPFRYLVFVPVYMIWKIPLYVAFFFKKKQKSWERTER
jgi:cellulose synthase/poly-beta-1,6-N-acetylglucosamine synthase-like glycosyltransferase